MSCTTRSSDLGANSTAVARCHLPHAKDNCDGRSGSNQPCTTLCNYPSHLIASSIVAGRRECWKPLTPNSLSPNSKLAPTSHRADCLSHARDKLRINQSPREALPMRRTPAHPKTTTMHPSGRSAIRDPPPLWEPLARASPRAPRLQVTTSNPCSRHQQGEASHQQCPHY